MRVLILFHPIVIKCVSGFCAANRRKEKTQAGGIQGFGEWEIWCIDIEQSGQVECNLNQVMRYKDHPDFRAMIVRFYSDGEGIVTLKIDYEWQTSFSKAYIQVDQLSPLTLEDCAKPCVIEDKRIAQLARDFAEGTSAQIRFFDYIVQEFNVDIELAQFAEAKAALHTMARKYR